MAAFVDSLIKEGKYASDSEVVVAALPALQAAQEREVLHDGHEELPDEQ